MQSDFTHHRPAHVKPVSEDSNMVPRPRLPSNPIRKRENGSVEFAGLTLSEAAKGCTALMVVWMIIAGFTAVMFVAAKAISGNSMLDRPGEAE